MAFYNQELKQIYSDLKSSENGINKKTILERQNKHGLNELEKQKRTSFFKRFIHEFSNIMIIILIVSALISCLTAILNHDYENLFEGVLIFAIVIINAFVGVLQSQKAENALEKLMDSTKPNARVLREGKEEFIPISNLVVGDIILLKTGNHIPADIRIISCNNFACNESSLTGESNPVQKNNNLISSKNTPLSNQSNMCFSGTSVTSGTAKGIVVAVGKSTELGKIAKTLSSNLKEKTPLEKNIDKIGKTITIGILAIVCVVFVVQVLFNKKTTIMDALLTAVTLAVAAIPESLPAVITIIMALGVQKLARKNAIIKKMSAIETLGCCNIICTDKTGTLTKNEMQVVHIFESQKLENVQTFSSSGNNYFILTAALCNNVSLSADGTISGDATEKAIANFLLQKQINFQKLKQNNSRTSENEFSSKRKIMSVVCKHNNNSFLFAKGAIDYILPKCTHILTENEIKPLSSIQVKQILKNNETACSEAERVVAFAFKNCETDSSETNLVFAGFVGIVDPPKKEVFSSIQECKIAGLKILMITGDHPTTAFAIAKKLGIASSKKEILTGEDLSKLGTSSLTKIINKYSVFARVTPEHKLMIVNALKENGHIVSMTGDGVNDAPSIKSANIGVCMGITGTDVTKEVSDIVISDDNFKSIVVAIKQGRTIYQNITKTIIFLISTNLVEVLGIFITSLLMHDAIFLLPTQILFINLVTDSLPAFALGIEPPEPTIMKKPPRNANQSLFSGSVGWEILYQGFIQTLVVLIMFVFAKWTYGNEVASTMSFLTICLMQIIHAINCKTEKSIFKINIFKNWFFNFSFIALLALILAVYFIPALATIFGLVQISGMCWVVIVLTSLLIIPLVEIGKIIIK